MARTRRLESTDNDIVVIGIKSLANNVLATPVELKVAAIDDFRSIAGEVLAVWCDIVAILKERNVSLKGLRRSE